MTRCFLDPIEEKENKKRNRYVAIHTQNCRTLMTNLKLLKFSGKEQLFFRPITALSKCFIKPLLSQIRFLDCISKPPTEDVPTGCLQHHMKQSNRAKQKPTYLGRVCQRTEAREQRPEFRAASETDANPISRASKTAK